MRQWLSKHHFCYRIFGSRATKEITEDYVLEVDSDEDDDLPASNVTPSNLEDSSSGSSLSFNPLTAKSSFHNIRDSVMDYPTTHKKTKGILIVPSQSTSSKDPSLAFSVDLDRDRFVRFGE